VQPTLIEEIYIAQAMDPQLEGIREEILVGKAPGFVIHAEGKIRFLNRVSALTMTELKKKVLAKPHNTLHSIHLGRE